MEIGFKRQMNQSFMTIQDQFDSREECELLVLANNKIPVLLPMDPEVLDGGVCYWYNITGYQSLADYLARRQLDMEGLRMLLSGLADLYRQLGEYLLAEWPVLLKEEYIYLDFAGKGLAFTYVPGWKEEPAEAFQELMGRLLQQLDHKDRGAVMVAYDIYQMSLQRELPLENMLQQAMEKYHCEKERQMSKTVPYPEAQAPEPARGENPFTGDFRRKSTEREEKGRFRERLSRKRGGHSNEAAYVAAPKRLSDPAYTAGQEGTAAHPTELLCGEGSTGGRLCYQGQKGLEDFILGEGDFLIGKKRQEVDGYLPERTVSRIHARIEKDGEDYYLEDLNSTNGTFLNGQRLEYRQKAKLAVGDRILLGNVEYRFI